MSELLHVICQTSDHKDMTQPCNLATPKYMATTAPELQALLLLCTELG